ncbi:MAG: cytochrome c [Euryarchaeota archaeon]|nr:cytochrome c [Euryarchaeota archaeon]
MALASVFLTVVLMTAVGIVSPPTVAKITAGRVEIIRGDPEAGMRVFGEKGCAVCHSIRGIGGKDAADLSMVDHARMDPMDMARVMWNHAPRMVPMMEEEGVPFPEMGEHDLRDLVAFLHSPATQEEFTEDMIVPLGRHERGMERPMA